MNETIIGMILEVGVGCYKAQAEGMEWNLYSSRKLNVGDYVECYALNDDDDPDTFYLEDANNVLSNAKDWKSQEENL